ncbi:MAG: hypothetical protein IK032_05320, partial [Bacteroidales bacterium]|nr:hypothetical protein [Bacteroidales bacterium]
IPGFRKGTAPMGLINRYYKSAVMADTVQEALNEALYKYIVDEKLDLLGTPISNHEKTGDMDFGKQTDFTFYFDAAYFPKMDIEWGKIDAKLYQVKVAAKDVDEQIESVCRNYGKFEVPEQINADDESVYASFVELEKGEKPEDAKSKFAVFEISKIKDEAIKQQFMGKKANDVVTLNVGKAFAAADIETIFHLPAAEAKKYKADIELTISSLAHVTPHEVNQELFDKMYPGAGITTVEQFKKNIKKDIEESYARQCEMMYVNDVEKWLLDNFGAELPTQFLQRYIAERSEKGTTLEDVVNNWETMYLPSIKVEILDENLGKEGNITPSHADVVNEVAGILKQRDAKKDDESDEDFDKRINQMAESIASDRKNVEQIYGRLRGNMMYALFSEKAKPATEKISIKEFVEKARQ